MKNLILIFLLLKIINIKAANILAVWPVTSRTQFSLGCVLFDELAKVGHTVRIVNFHNSPLKNLSN